MGQAQQQTDSTQELAEKAASLTEEHRAEVRDFIDFLAAKEAEDRADYEAAAEAYRTMGETLSLDEVEQRLGLGG